MKNIITLIFLVMSIESYACVEPPPEHHVPDSELLSRTKDIVLGRVIKAEVIEDDWHIKYTFKTVQSLKGNIPEKFTIVGLPTSQNSFNHFKHHEDATFWEQYGGREFNGPDCEISPSFAIGENYLVFLNPPYHGKGFELIIKTHELTPEIDKWLEFVEKHIP